MLGLTQLLLLVQQVNFRGDINYSTSTQEDFLVVKMVWDTHYLSGNRTGGSPFPPWHPTLVYKFRHPVRWNFWLWTKSCIWQQFPMKTWRSGHPNPSRVCRSEWPPQKPVLTIPFRPPINFTYTVNINIVYTNIILQGHPRRANLTRNAIKNPRGPCIPGIILICISGETDTIANTVHNQHVQI